MALEYFLYSTLYNNTLVDRCDTTFVPLPPDTGQIHTEYFIPTIQPLYYYRETVSTIVLNDEDTINAYLEGTAPAPGPEDNVTQHTFTGYTATTDTRYALQTDFTGYTASTAVQLTGIENDVAYLSGQTDTKLNIGDFETYSGITDSYIGTKIDKVTGATGNLAIFLIDGNVEDSGVTIDSITGGTGYYYYIDKTSGETTTSTTNIIYLSGRSGVLTAGSWSIDFNAIGGNNSPNKYIGVSFYIDNVLQGYENYFKTNDANVVMPFVISKDLTLTAGTHLFEIRYRNTGGIARLEYGSIRARIVN